MLNKLDFGNDGLSISAISKTTISLNTHVFTNQTPKIHLLLGRFELAAIYEMQNWSLIPLLALKPRSCPSKPPELVVNPCKSAICVNWSCGFEYVHVWQMFFHIVGVGKRNSNSILSKYREGTGYSSYYLDLLREQVTYRVTSFVARWIIPLKTGLTCFWHPF